MLTALFEPTLGAPSVMMGRWGPPGPHRGSKSFMYASYRGSSSNLRFTTPSVNWGRQQESRGVVKG